jgi:hypothetical protein
MFGGSISATKLPIKSLYNIKTQLGDIKFDQSKLILVDIQFIGNQEISKFINTINEPSINNMYLAGDSNIKSLFKLLSNKDKLTSTNTKQNKYGSTTSSSNMKNNQHDVLDTYTCLDNLHEQYLGDDVYWCNNDFNDDLGTFSNEYIHAGSGVSNLKRSPIITLYTNKSQMKFQKVSSEEKGEKITSSNNTNYIVYPKKEGKSKKILSDNNTDPRVYIVSNPTRDLTQTKMYIVVKQSSKIVLKEVSKTKMNEELNNYRTANSSELSNFVLTSDIITELLNSINYKNVSK